MLSYRKSYIFITIALCSLELGCTDKNIGKVKALTSLPAFKTYLYDSSVLISSQDIPKGNPIILIYFSPTCENCQFEIRSITSHREIFNSSTILLITNESFDELKRFVKTNNIDSFANIIATKDFEYTFYAHFKPEKIPFIAVYNKNKQLTRIFDQQTDVTLLKRTIEE